MVSDPSKKILDYIEPNNKGVYKALVEFSPGNTKWKTFFPDSKSEIGVAKSIENVYNQQISNIKTDLVTGGKYLEGVDATGINIRIDLLNNLNVSTAFPLFN